MVGNPFLGAYRSTNPMEKNNCSAVSFQLGPKNDSDLALMEVMSSETDNDA